MHQDRAGWQPGRSTPAGDYISCSPCPLPRRWDGQTAGTARDRAWGQDGVGGGLGCEQLGPPSCRPALGQDGRNGGP